jgi:capsular polysaccharide biosynthesis protein
MRNLSIGRYNRITLVPVVRRNEFGISFQIGAYHSNGEFLPSIALRRDYGMSGRALPQRATKFMKGEYLYGGLLRRHYGHFLLESLARTYAFSTRTQIPIVWHIESKPGLLTWQADIFTILKIDFNNFIYIDEATEFETFLVPEVGYKIQDWFHPAHEIALGQYRSVNTLGCDRIWLSRSRLPSEAGNVIAVDDLEAELAETGWHVVHPQEHTIPEQLALFTNAKLIAGFAGSALHTLILVREIKAKIAIISRGEVMNRNYLTIAKAKNLDQIVISAPLQKIGGAGHQTQYRLSDPALLISILNRL